MAGYKMSRKRSRAWTLAAVLASLGVFLSLWWLAPSADCTVTDVVTLQRCEGAAGRTVAYSMLGLAASFGVAGAMYRYELKRMRREVRRTLMAQHMQRIREGRT